MLRRYSDAVDLLTHKRGAVFKSMLCGGAQLERGLGPQYGGGSSTILDEKGPFMVVPVTFWGTEELTRNIFAERFFQVRPEDEGWEDQELEIIDNLKALLITEYSDRYVFVDENIWQARQLTVEATVDIVHQQFISLLLYFLQEYAPKHGIGMLVDRPDPTSRKDRSKDLGRITVTLREIAVEKVFQPVWEQQVGCTAFEVSAS